MPTCLSEQLHDHIANIIYERNPSQYLLQYLCEDIAKQVGLSLHVTTTLLCGFSTNKNLTKEKLTQIETILGEDGKLFRQALSQAQLIALQRGKSDESQGKLIKCIPPELRHVLRKIVSAKDMPVLAIAKATGVSSNAIVHIVGGFPSHKKGKLEVLRFLEEQTSDQEQKALINRNITDMQEQLQHITVISNRELTR